MLKPDSQTNARPSIGSSVIFLARQGAFFGWLAGTTLAALFIVAGSLSEGYVHLGISMLALVIGMGNGVFVGLFVGLPIYYLVAHLNRDSTRPRRFNQILMFAWFSTLAWLVLRTDASYDSRFLMAGALVVFWLVSGRVSGNLNRTVGVPGFSDHSAGLR